MPAVSVVIPLYNKGPYIARALNSVLTQTFQDFEVIVVDDGSTDDGAEIVREFTDPRIKLIQQENQGVSAARNRGIEASLADLIAFLDADDEWLPRFLETTSRLKDRFPSAGAYATAVNTSYKGIIKRSRYRSVPSPNWEGLITDYFRSAVFGDSILLSSSVAIPRDILLEMSGFIIGEKWGEDLDLWGRIALKYSIGFSTSYCSIIHVTSENLEKIRGRATATRENPFIKSAGTIIESEQSTFTDRCYLMLYLDKIIMESALYNVIIGEKHYSKEILSKCMSNTFVLTRVFLNTWYMISGCITNRDNKIFEKSPLIILLYLLPFEARMLASIMEFKRSLRNKSLKRFLDGVTHSLRSRSL
ncbi:glycosyltransferase family 2 protein [Methanoculleus sp. YWC-01]|uniref:Glycosyltransferase family 2 protein n=1 Tax=Methanoculleus nereidis TaxID=2735141 RepID=A0ABU3Z361_9EURY|nr:glycosyltransferase family A protein [Methanoculleus sp. YWC-01]MDV4343030.1 glycosyltransferase family 2 protein [Methanoculleus sp. YWC-01]